MSKKLSLEMTIARALYCQQSGDPNYDFEADPKGWAVLGFRAMARAAIKAYREHAGL